MIWNVMDWNVNNTCHQLDFGFEIIATELYHYYILICSHPAHLRIPQPHLYLLWLEEHIYMFVKLFQIKKKYIYIYIIFHHLQLQNF